MPFVTVFELWMDIYIWSWEMMNIWFYDIEFIKVGND